MSRNKTNANKGKTNQANSDSRTTAYARIARIWEVISGRDKGIPGPDEIRREILAVKEEVTVTQKKKRRENFIYGLTIASSVAAVIGLLFSGYQMKQAADAFDESLKQFTQSGPQYSFFYTDINPGMRLETDGGTINLSGQSSVGLVLSNTGRTADSVVSLRRNTENRETLTVCIPELDEDGNLVDREPATLDAAMIRLEPGESRLVFLTGQREDYAHEEGDSFRGTGFEIVHDIMVYGASGIEREAEYKKDVPEPVMEYYTTLPGYDEAREICGNLVEAYSGTAGE